MNTRFSQSLTATLTGAVIGTELGLRHGGSDLAASDSLTWGPLPISHPKISLQTSLVPAWRSVVRAYVKAGGRITPEDWAPELSAEKELVIPGFFWFMDMNSALELLQEGMNPRLTGIGSTPSGSVSGVCVPVGVFHAGDPDAAYVDAMELASVWQRRPASDWAALSASAVAAALQPAATPASVIAETLQVAENRAPEVHQDLLRILAEAAGQSAETIGAQLRSGAPGREWWAYNPVGLALALLQEHGETPVRALQVAARMNGGYAYGAVFFALIGALQGEAAFDESWRVAARPLAEPLLALLPVIDAKLDDEQGLVRTLEAVLTPGPSGDELLYEKIYGCILAGAIGNAMGSPVENQLFTAIDAAHPGGIKTVLDPSRLENEDDNQMALLLTKTYLRLEGRLVTARDVGQTWMKEMVREGFWLCCRSTYDVIKNGMDPRIAGHWNWVTGSTVMCMEPVGVYHLGDARGAWVDGMAVSYLEQRGLDVTAAAILSVSVAEAMRADATVDSVLQAALDVAPREPLKTFNDRGGDSPYSFISRCLEVADHYTDVLAARAELYEKCLYYHPIDPLELLGLAYAMFKIADGDVRQAAIGGTNIGRDSDTIAGRAAMLAGTLRGAQTIPGEWTAMFSDRCLSVLQDVSRQFVALHRDQRLPAFQQRQAWYG